MSKIFISYAYADGADIARQLVAELEAAGSPCWMGQRDMKTGEDFPPQIVRAIRECRALVVLLTPKANGSRDVLQEVSLAHNAQKPMVPLIVRNATPSDGLAYYLGIVQQVAWNDARTAAAAVRTVLTGGTVGSVVAGTRATNVIWLRALPALATFLSALIGVFTLESVDFALPLMGTVLLGKSVSVVLIWNWRRLGVQGFIATAAAEFIILCGYAIELFGDYLPAFFIFVAFALISLSGSTTLALLVRPHWARFK